MKQTLRAGLWALLAVSLASGCTRQSVNDGGGADATGSLGSPTVPDSPATVYIDLSAAYLRENQLTDSYKNAKKAVIVDPRSSNAHLMLAIVQQRLGEVDAAASSYRKAVSLDPRNPDALNAFGSFLCERKDFDDADKHFRRALANPLYRTPWIAWHNAGQCQEMAGDAKRAEADYRGALQVNPRFAPSLLSMAKISFNDDNFLSTRAYLQRYGEVAAHTAESLWLGYRTERQLGDKDQTASYGLKLKSKFPDSQEAKYLQSSE